MAGTAFLSVGSAYGGVQSQTSSHCAHRFFLEMSRVGHLIGHMPAWAQLAVLQSIFAPSFATCAAGSWLAQLVFARSVFSHGFLSAQKLLGRRSAPAVQWLHSIAPRIVQPKGFSNLLLTSACSRCCRSQRADWAKAGLVTDWLGDGWLGHRGGVVASSTVACATGSRLAQPARVQRVSQGSAPAQSRASSRSLPLPMSVR